MSWRDEVAGYLAELQGALARSDWKRTQELLSTDCVGTYCFLSHISLYCPNAETMRYILDCNPPSSFDWGPAVGARPVDVAAVIMSRVPSVPLRRFLQRGGVMAERVVLRAVLSVRLPTSIVREHF
jgi:hypothetical protein